MLAGVYADERTLHVAPLSVREHKLGVLSMTFRGHGVVEEETQITLLTTLAEGL